MGGIGFTDEEIQNLDVSTLEVTPICYNYSHQRIKEVFDIWGFELKPYYVGYKAMRYRKCQYYVVVEKSTGKIVGRRGGYPLFNLRVIMTNLHIPLKSDKYIHKKIRNKNAKKFLEICEKL